MKYLPCVVAFALDVRLKTEWQTPSLAAELLEGVKFIDSKSTWPTNLVKSWIESVASPMLMDEPLNEHDLVCDTFGANEACESHKPLVFKSPLLVSTLDALVANRYFDPNLIYQDKQSRREFDLLNQNEPYPSTSWYSAYQVSSNGAVVAAGWSLNDTVRLELIDDTIGNQMLTLLKSNDIWKPNAQAQTLAPGTHKIYHSELTHNSQLMMVRRDVLHDNFGGFRYYHAETSTSGSTHLTDWTGSLILKNPEYKALNEIQETELPSQIKVKPESEVIQTVDVWDEELKQSVAVDSLHDLVTNPHNLAGIGPATVHYIRSEIRKFNLNQTSACDQYVVEAALPKLSCLRGITANILSHLPDVVKEHDSAALRSTTSSIQSLHNIVGTRFNGALLDKQQLLMIPSSSLMSHLIGKFHFRDFIPTHILPLALREEFLYQSLSDSISDVAVLKGEVTVARLSDVLDAITRHQADHGRVSSASDWKRTPRPRVVYTTNATRFTSPFADVLLKTVSARMFIAELRYALAGYSPIEIGMREPSDFLIGEVNLSLTLKKAQEILPDLLEDVSINGVTWTAEIVDDEEANVLLQRFLRQDSVEGLPEFIRNIHETAELPQLLKQLRTPRLRPNVALVNGFEIDLNAVSSMNLQTQIVSRLEADLENFVRSILGVGIESELLSDLKSGEEIVWHLKYRDLIMRFAKESAWTSNPRPSVKVKAMVKPLVIKDSKSMLTVKEHWTESPSLNAPIPLVIYLAEDNHAVDLSKIHWRAELPVVVKAVILRRFNIDNAVRVCHASSIEDVRDGSLKCEKKLAWHQQMDSFVVAGRLHCEFESQMELTACIQDLVDRSIDLLAICLHNDEKCEPARYLQAVSKTVQKNQISFDASHAALTLAYPPSTVEDEQLDKIFAKPSLRHIRVSSDGNNGSAVVKFFIDPLSVSGQVASYLAEYINLYMKLNVQVLLSNHWTYKSLPLNRWTRHVLSPPLSFQLSDMSNSTAHAHFDHNITTEILTFEMGTHPYIHVRSSNAEVDMDNIMLDNLSDQEAPIEYRVSGFRIEGSIRRNHELAPTTGVQLELQASSKRSREDSTRSLEKPNYYQLVAPDVGDYNIVVKPSDVSEHVLTVSEGRPTVEQRRLYAFSDGTDTAIKLDSWEAVLSSRYDVNTNATASPRETTQRLTNSDPKRIHVFSLASGHMYERLLRIMMMSVVKNTRRPVTFWLLEDFLSSQFQQKIAQVEWPLGTEIRYVSYGWPSWVRGQVEKQRQIWARKILFLDLLFPPEIDQVIYVDADQIVRGDLAELWDLKMGKNELGEKYVYAFTPFCDDREEMKPYRFWETGYWKDYLASITEISKNRLDRQNPLPQWLRKVVGSGGSDVKRKYHISALFKVDLNEFKRQNVGDLLRDTYNRLTMDPNSLANLDQDLPNSVQHLVPIYSLSQEWLWCETWCSDATKKKAKTIDLCNNPLTKEPKLKQAQRIIAEWNEYDALTNGAIKCEKKKPKSEL